MTSTEYLLLAGIVTCGAAFGWFSALVTRRREEPFIDTLIWTVLGAPLISGAVLFLGGFFAAIQRWGFNPGRAVLGGMSTCAFGIGIHFLFGASAVMVGLAAQCIFRYCSPRE